jgi:hypothetical protein
MPPLSPFPWFPVIRDGDDLVVPRTAATWFGGDSDPGDNGQTACGFSTKGHPTLLGCALPLAGYGVQSLRGTPLPMMAFGLHHDGTPNPDGAWVEVSLLGDRPELPTPNSDLPAPLTLPVIDLGPSLRTRHGIDLTVAAFRHFAGGLSRGVITVSYRLKRGALYLKTPEAPATPNIQHSTSDTQHPIGGGDA